MHTRREFIGGVAGAAAWAAVPGKDEISLAAWSINRSFFVNHRWTNLDLPKICRENVRYRRARVRQSVLRQPDEALP